MASKSAKSRRHVVTRTSYAGKKYECYGKHVRTGKSKTKRPRVFCGKADTK